MTYPEALKYLDSFVNYENKNGYNYKRSFNLDRMKRLSALLGNPQKGIRSIHIAGSKGKGSTSAFVQSILRNANFNVGLYTSPHLSSFTERIRINDSLISHDDVAGLLERVKIAVDKMKGDRPSFFEVYTAIAYLYFKTRKVDFAVYEVGLGGRLDATNVVEPMVCAITPISYEHTDKLGDTLEEIALEKAGIIKYDSMCVVSPQKKEAFDAIEKHAREKRSKLILVGPSHVKRGPHIFDVSFDGISARPDEQVFNVSGLAAEYSQLKTRLLGEHQISNAATAIGVAEALRFFGIIIPSEAIRLGVERTVWAGRMEVVNRRPYIILDGAQNKASANALAKAVKKIFKYKRLILVLGVSKDKDIKGMLTELLPISDSVVLTKSKVVGRAMEPGEIEKSIKEKAGVVLTSNVSEAVNTAVSLAGPNDLILVTGSLFVVGEARENFIPGVEVRQGGRAR